MKEPFKPIPSPFGEQFGRDEMATQAAFVEYVGGHARAELLSRLWRESFPYGMYYDRLMNAGARKAREDVFRSKAKREGFSDLEIDAFLML